MRRLLVLALIALGSTAALAHADIPLPAPESCPRGSIGVATSDVSYCAPTVCAPCGSNQRCSPDPIALCVLTSDMPIPARPWMPGAPTSMRIREVTGVCENGRCTTEGARCERAPRCLPLDDEAFSGLCSASHARASMMPPFALTLAFAILIARRRASKAMEG